MFSKILAASTAVVLLAACASRNSAPATDYAGAKAANQRAAKEAGTAVQRSEQTLHVKP